MADFSFFNSSLEEEFFPSPQKNTEHSPQTPHSSSPSFSPLPPLTSSSSSSPSSSLSSSSSFSIPTEKENKKRRSETYSNVPGKGDFFSSKKDK